MSGYDANRIFSVAVHDAPPPQDLDKPAEAERMLLDFLLQYRVGGEFIYRYVSSVSTLKLTHILLRDKLRANLLLKQYYLEVDLQHVGLYNEEMAHALQERPGEIIPSVCLQD